MANEIEQNQTNELRSICDIMADLSKPIAWRHLQKRLQGKKEIYYISWDYTVKYLNLYAKGWSYNITSIHSIGGKLIMTVAISIPCLEGVVIREASGQEDENVDAYGDSSSNAESMALRRAASKFGFGLYLYDDLSNVNPNNSSFNRAVYDATVSNKPKTETPEIQQKEQSAPKVEPKAEKASTVKQTPKEGKKEIAFPEGLLRSLVNLSTKYEQNEKTICEAVSNGKIHHYEDLSFEQANEALKLIQERNG